MDSLTKLREAHDSAVEAQKGCAHTHAIAADYVPLEKTETAFDAALAAVGQEIAECQERRPRGVRGDD